MMIDWLLILILMAMPWKPGAFWQIARVPVVWNARPCSDMACYYNSTVYLSPEWRNDPFDYGLRAAVTHEFMHYFACKEKVWENEGGWPAFQALVARSIPWGELTTYQREIINALWDIPFELHGTLPHLLGGDIPPSLQDWYPWFDLKGE